MYRTTVNYRDIDRLNDVFDTPNELADQNRIVEGCLRVMTAGRDWYDKPTVTIIPLDLIRKVTTKHSRNEVQPSEAPE